MANLLQRLARSQERLVMYVDGHGEPKLDGQANFDLGDFGRQLGTKGFRIQALNLTVAPEVPDNASVLVITPPARGHAQGGGRQDQALPRARRQPAVAHRPGAVAWSAADRRVPAPAAHPRRGGGSGGGSAGHRADHRAIGELRAACDHRDVLSLHHRFPAWYAASQSTRRRRAGTRRRWWRWPPTAGWKPET